MPAELWLSSNPGRVPSRVCVMAILIVALRVLYGINGQGIWEVSFPYRPRSLRHVVEPVVNTDELNFIPF